MARSKARRTGYQDGGEVDDAPAARLSSPTVMFKRQRAMAQRAKAGQSAIPLPTYSYQDGGDVLSDQSSSQQGDLGGGPPPPDVMSEPQRLYERLPPAMSGGLPPNPAANAGTDAYGNQILSTTQKQTVRSGSRPGHRAPTPTSDLPYTGPMPTTNMPLPGVMPTSNMPLAGPVPDSARVRPPPPRGEPSPADDAGPAQPKPTRLNLPLRRGLRRPMQRVGYADGGDVSSPPPLSDPTAMFYRQKMLSSRNAQDRSAAGSQEAAPDSAQEDLSGDYGYARGGPVQRVGYADGGLVDDTDQAIEDERRRLAAAQADEPRDWRARLRQTGTDDSVSTQTEGQPERSAFQRMLDWAHQKLGLTAEPQQGPTQGQASAAAQGGGPDQVGALETGFNRLVTGRPISGYAGMTEPTPEELPAWAQRLKRGEPILPAEMRSGPATSSPAREEQPGEKQAPPATPIPAAEDPSFSPLRTESPLRRQGLQGAQSLQDLLHGVGAASPEWLRDREQQTAAKMPGAERSAITARALEEHVDNDDMETGHAMVQGLRQHYNAALGGAQAAWRDNNRAGAVQLINEAMNLAPDGNTTRFTLNPDGSVTATSRPARGAAPTGYAPETTGAAPTDRGAQRSVYDHATDMRTGRPVGRVRDTEIPPPPFTASQALPGPGAAPVSTAEHPVRADINDRPYNPAAYNNTGRTLWTSPSQKFPVSVPIPPQINRAPTPAELGWTNGRRSDLAPSTMDAIEAGRRRAAASDETGYQVAGQVAGPPHAPPPLGPRGLIGSFPGNYVDPNGGRDWSSRTYDSEGRLEPQGLASTGPQAAASRQPDGGNQYTLSGDQFEAIMHGPGLQFDHLGANGILKNLQIASHPQNVPQQVSQTGYDVPIRDQPQGQQPQQPQKSALADYVMRARQGASDTWRQPVPMSDTPEFAQAVDRYQQRYLRKPDIYDLHQIGEAVERNARYQAEVPKQREQEAAAYKAHIDWINSLTPEQRKNWELRQKLDNFYDRLDEEAKPRSVTPAVRTDRLDPQKEWATTESSRTKDASSQRQSSSTGAKGGESQSSESSSDVERASSSSRTPHWSPGMQPVYHADELAQKQELERWQAAQLARERAGPRPSQRPGYHERLEDPLPPEHFAQSPFYEEAAKAYGQPVPARPSAPAPSIWERIFAGGKGGADRSATENAILSAHDRAAAAGDVPPDLKRLRDTIIQEQLQRRGAGAAGGAGTVTEGGITYRKVGNDWVRAQ